MIIIIKYDYTFWLHMIRDAFFTVVIASIYWFIINFICVIQFDPIPPVMSGFLGSLAFNLAWEYQDGLHNDGFNILDFLGGMIGSILMVVSILIIAANIRG